MGVDEDRAGAAVGCDIVGWEGVVGDEVEYFAGACVEGAAATRAHTWEAKNKIGVVSRAGRGAGRETYFK